jgi:tetratricopeptide (TPR) repeat protein
LVFTLQLRRMIIFGYRKIALALLLAAVSSLVFSAGWTLPRFLMRADEASIVALAGEKLSGVEEPVLIPFGVEEWDGEIRSLAWDALFGVWLLVFMALALIFVGAALFAPEDVRTVAPWALACGVVAIGLIKASFALWRWEKPLLPDDQRLPIASLQRVLDSADGDPVFANARAGLIARALTDPEFPLLDDGGAASGNPGAWRELDRKHRFGAVYFLGRPQEFRPLLDHLLNSPDWRLGWVDQHGLCFLRGAGTPWSPGEPPESESTVEAEKMARTALNLSAAGRNGDARRWFTAALELAPRSVPVAAMHASFLAQRGQWNEALSEAERALVFRSGYMPALQIKVQTLLELRRPAEAWRTAEELLKVSPRDLFSLFLHARAANAVGAFYSEQNSLERLIAISARSGLPVENYRIYLGQCFARQGFGQQALDQFDLVLSSPGLGEEQRRIVMDARQAVADQIAPQPRPAPEN